MDQAYNISGEKQKRQWLIVQFHTAVDLALSSLSFVAAYYTKKYFLPGAIKGLSISPNYYIILLLICILWYICFRLVHSYDNFSEKKMFRIIFEVIKSVSLGMFLLIAFLFLFNIKEISRLLLGLFFLYNVLSLVLWKSIIKAIMSRHKKYGHSIHNVLILGSKSRAEGVIRLLKGAQHQYHIIGCIELEPGRTGEVVKDDVKIIGSIDDIQHILTTNVIDEVIITMPLKLIDAADAYIFLFELMGISVRIFPDWQIHAILYSPGIAQIQYDELIGIPSLLLKSTSSRHHDLLLKSSFDYIFSTFALLISLPLFILFGLLIKLCSKGPIFFAQERVGLNGRKFYVYKFRTMVQDAEKKLKELKDKNEADGPVFKIKKDPRVIPVIGTLLRKTSLDELPQLINVVKGEMSLVGPRPPIQSEVDNYNIWQRRRLSMKPGITCVWQVQPNRNDLTFCEWMNLDLHYIDNWSLGLDFKILFKTVFAVFGGHGR